MNARRPSVHVAIEDAVEGALRGHQPFAEFPYRAVAAVAGHYHVGVFANDGEGIGDRHADTGKTDGGQVRQVVAHVGHFVGLDAHGFHHFFQRDDLVFTTLHQLADFQVAGALLYQLGRAAGDDGDFHAGGPQQLDAKAVLDVEGLGLVAEIGVVEAAVG